MRVRIRLFARLRELAGAGELELAGAGEFVREVAPGATVASVWAALAEEFPALGAYSSSISGAVNAEYAPMTHPVHDGDEVAFLPPVSGGAFRSRRSVRGAADTASGARCSHIAYIARSAPAGKRPSGLSSRRHGALSPGPRPVASLLRRA